MRWVWVSGALGLRRAQVGVGAAIALCLLAPAQFASAARNTEARLAAFAALPDWTGLWVMGRPGGAEPDAPQGAIAAPSALAPGPREDFPYNAEWQARYNAVRGESAGASAAQRLPDNTLTPCTWGFPRVLDGPYEFEVTVTPEQTMFNYDVREYRHVWTDGRHHPPAAVRKPSDMGHSIGHWEGETLVIDTAGLVSGLWINDRGATLSEQAHVTERWTQPDKDHLEVLVMIEDPIAFTRPYQGTHVYHRVSDTNRIVQRDCFDTVKAVLAAGQGDAQ